MADNNLNMVDVDEHITEVVHHTGTTFHIYLTSQELLRANTDPTFAEEISEKYYELYQKGLVRAVETASLPEDSGTTPNNDDNENKIRWTDHQIKFLISLYRQHFMDPTSKGKKTNKSLYIEMAKKCNEKDILVSWQQIETKIKGLLKTYKNIKDNNTASGRGAIRWQYYDCFEEFMKNRPEVLPRTIASNINCENKNLADSSQSSITMTPTTSDAEGNCDTPNHTTPEAVTPGSTRVSRKRSRIAARLATEEPEWFKKYREDAMLRHQERMEVLNKLTNILNSLCH